MTTEQQYIAIGKAHSDLTAKKERLKALKLGAADLGHNFARIGWLLKTDPQYAGLNGESSMPADMLVTNKAELFDRKIFDADEFRNITNEIRDTLVEIERLEKLLR